MRSIIELSTKVYCRRDCDPRVLVGKKLVTLFSWWARTDNPPQREAAKLDDQHATNNDEDRYAKGSLTACSKGNHEESPAWDGL